MAEWGELIKFYFVRSGDDRATPTVPHIPESTLAGADTNREKN